ncbi:hypothetical protein PF008_g12181 [Phytophthora fragariae]|uniref:Uncharacterized protein n=1 Tax=Phytophthora fragariae TaxID=53985 RepID=A0A6G0RQ53_9STRA|nr:hypothetical protein PF008_g12181 [Phytophthora fragariae]
MDGTKAKRRAVSRSTKRGAKNQRPITKATSPLLTDDSPLGQLCCVLELGAPSVWRYLTPEETSSIFQAVGSALSQDLVESIASKALDGFAVENKTHLGGECQCDWMGDLSFTPYYESKNNCNEAPPFTASKNIPIFQTPGSAAALLSALLLTKKLLDTVSWANRFVSPAYYPVVCPLLSGAGQSFKNKAAVTRAMNAICPGAGSHFFYKSTKTKGSTRSHDYLYEHWDGINGMSCQYCDDLVAEENGRWALKGIESICANCKSLYRPLKDHMKQNLQFVRCVRRPRRHVSHFFDPYEGLVAGITSDGVLCGLYLNLGFWGDD